MSQGTEERVIREISKGFREQTDLDMELQGCTCLDLGRRDAFTVQHSNWKNNMSKAQGWKS